MNALVELSTEVQSDSNSNKVQSSVKATIAALLNDLTTRPYLLAASNVHPYSVAGRISTNAVE